MTDQPTLEDVIAKWRTAAKAWKTAADADDRDHDDEWSASERAEAEMIFLPCHTLEDIRAKVRIALEDENVFDSILNCGWDGERMLYGFLRSLLGEPGFPSGKIGGDQ
jgi:hypothetical protein